MFGVTQRRRLLVACMILGLLLVILSQRRLVRRRSRLKAKSTAISGTSDKAIVFAKSKEDDVRWALDLGPNWTSHIYTTSQPPEKTYLYLPSARGRRSAVYLTFIIDNYNSLPSYIAFVQGSQGQQHNDVLDTSTSLTLSNLHLPSIDKQGYADLRCNREPQCPISVDPWNPTDADADEQGTNDAKGRFPEIYMHLLKATSRRVPSEVGCPGGNQFIVTRKQILARPREDYERMREWAMSVADRNSNGVDWIFERLWHIVFGMPAVHCPPVDHCRCILFDWCTGEVPGWYSELLKKQQQQPSSWLGRWLGSGLE